MLESAKLGEDDVASIILGQSPPSSAYNQAGEGLPFFQGKADFGLLHPVPRIWCTAGQKFADTGDILISVRAPVGDVNIATGNCAIGRGVAAIRPGKRTDPWYLYFALVHAKPELESRSTGSTFASVNRATLNDLEIPLPAKPEQARIGAILRVIVEKLDQEAVLLARAQDLKHAAMRELFTRGLRGEVQKDSQAGLLPASWQVARFLDAFEIARGQVDPKVEPYASMLHVGPENIEQGSGHLLPCTAARDLGLISGKYLFREADILYSKIRPHLRKVALASVGGICSADMYPLSVKGDFDRYFLFAFLLSDTFTDQATRHEIRTGIPKINREQLATISVPKPSLDEQREIGAVFAAIDQKIDLHRRKHAALDHLFKAVLNKLMTGEIRVGDIDLLAHEREQAAEVTV
jgi:type I restriction enzyme S subunit